MNIFRFASKDIVTVDIHSLLEQTNSTVYLATIQIQADDTLVYNNSVSNPITAM